MEQLASLFSALADPTRLRILSLLSDGELCVCHLQQALGTHQPKISRHLAYLRRTGLVEPKRNGKWMYYALSKTDQSLSPILNTILKQLEKEKQPMLDRKRIQKTCA